LCAIYLFLSRFMIHFLISKILHDCHLKLYIVDNKKEDLRAISNTLACNFNEFSKLCISSILCDHNYCLKYLHTYHTHILIPFFIFNFNLFFFAILSFSIKSNWIFACKEDKYFLLLWTSYKCILSRNFAAIYTWFCFLLRFSKQILQVYFWIYLFKESNLDLLYLNFLRYSDFLLVLTNLLAKIYDWLGKIRIFNLI
jgi:hypothetical protein